MPDVDEDEFEEWPSPSDEDEGDEAAMDIMM